MQPISVGALIKPLWRDSRCFNELRRASQSNITAAELFGKLLRNTSATWNVCVLLMCCIILMSNYTGVGTSLSTLSGPVYQLQVSAVLGMLHQASLYSLFIMGGLWELWCVGVRLFPYKPLLGESFPAHKLKIIFP